MQYDSVIKSIDHFDMEKSENLTSEEQSYYDWGYSMITFNSSVEPEAIDLYTKKDE
jgi:hypothetical protein